MINLKKAILSNVNKHQQHFDKSHQTAADRVSERRAEMDSMKSNFIKRANTINRLRNK